MAIIEDACGACDDDFNKVTAPISIVAPQVKWPKRLDVDRDAERACGVPGVIAANLINGRL